MFLTFAVFFAAVFLFNFKVIIRTVIVQDFVVSFAEKVAVFIQFGLDQVNLKPAKLAGVLSEGMLLCAEDENGELSLMVPEKKMPAGAEIC